MRGGAWLSVIGYRLSGMRNFSLRYLDYPEFASIVIVARASGLCRVRTLGQFSCLLIPIVFGNDGCMNTPATTPSAEEEAVTTINGTIDEASSSDTLLKELEKKAQEAEGEKQKHIQKYIAGVRPEIQSVLVEDLGDTGGGLYDGNNVTIGKAALYVYDDVQTAVANAEEVRRHEDYHEEHDHTAPMTTGDSAEGEIVVTMGKEKFTDEALIEGLTVRRTGEQFVSDEYKQFRRKFDQALRASGKTIEDVEEAIAEKDLRLIDDANQTAIFAQAV